jgi:predicted ATP-binding protein involved in virulence
MRRLGRNFGIMLKRLYLKNFTVFADADFEFGPGLNVLVGTNGTGKSHVLKVGYAVEVVREEIKNIDFTPKNIHLPRKENEWSSRLFYELPDIFQTQLKQLVSFDTVNANAVIEAEFETGYFEVEYSKNEAISLEINRDLDSIRVVGGGEIVSEKIKVVPPAFIPSREILTSNWMIPASKQLFLPIERNYLDLLERFQLLPLRQPESSVVIKELKEVLGGELREVEGKYYLIDKNGNQVGISMVAEGLRKFGMLQRLLENGSFTSRNTLFWDEPEANLNPALLRKLAAILAELARQGFQIILATHSMSLLKEFHILSREADKEKLPIKYFGLNAEPGQPTTVVTRDDFKYLPDVVALEVELDQADDLEEIFARENR